MASDRVSSTCLEINMKDSNQLLEDVSSKNVTDFNINRKTSFQIVCYRASPTYKNGGATPLLDYANPRFEDLTAGQTTNNESTSINLEFNEVTYIMPHPGISPKTMTDQPKQKSEQNEIMKNTSFPQDQIKVLEREELIHIPQTHLAIGLLVLCCFNLPFGILALYFSLRAAAAYRDRDNIKGPWYARASIVLSLIGIMLTMMVVSSIVVYIAVNKHSGRKNPKLFSSSALVF